MPPPNNAEKRALSTVASYVDPSFHYVSTRELVETVSKKIRTEDKLSYGLLEPPIKPSTMVYKHTLNANGKREVKKALPRTE